MCSDDCQGLIYVEQGFNDWHVLNLRKINNKTTDYCCDFLPSLICKLVMTSSSSTCVISTLCGIVLHSYLCTVPVTSVIVNTWLYLPLSVTGVRSGWRSPPPSFASCSTQFLTRFHLILFFLFTFLPLVLSFFYFSIFFFHRLLVVTARLP